jgi:transposase-like protein
MENYPKTVLELRERFPDEDACRRYLIALRWPSGFICPKCSHSDAWITARRQFHCRHCGRQTTVTAGTLFADSHLPLRLWFEAIWQVTAQKYGASALGLQRVLGLGSYRSAWTLLHKFRRAMVRPGRERLKGMVEVDEIFIGGARKQLRKFENKEIVVVAAEEEKPGKIGRIRLERVPDRTASSLLAAVQRLVEPGARIRTDESKGYGRLPELGFAHEPIQSTAWGPKNILPSVNRVASLLKRWLLGTTKAPPSLTTWIITSMSSRSDLIAATPAPAACSSTA